MHERNATDKTGNGSTATRAAKTAQQVAELPLPARAHVPGCNPRNEDEWLHELASRAETGINCHSASTSMCWRYGLRLFNHGFYWETHELLEPLWQRAAANSRERFLIRAGIQLANAALKHRQGLGRATDRLLGLCEQDLQRAYGRETSVLMGLAEAQIRAAIARLRNGDEMKRTLDYEL